MKNIHLIKSDKQTNLILSKLGLKLIKLDSFLNSNIYFATTSPKIYITNTDKIEAGDWVLPPSFIPFRYYKNINNDEQLKDCKKIIHTIEATYQNVYITSDEEIKEGDWVIYNNDLQKSDGISFKSVDKKITLTTDVELIKDGVQAIDDEFLEWFVKNPSCEMVDINRDWGYPAIIVPKEKPKTLTKLEIAKNIAAIGIGKKEEPKQETLEEAAKKYGREQPYQELFDYLSNELNVIALLTQMQEIEAIVMAKQKHINNAKETDEEAAKKHSGIAYNRQDYEEQYYNPIGCIKYDSFIEVVKWDSENRYSKEEVLKLLKKAHFVDENIDDWFEKNKKQ